MKAVLLLSRLDQTGMTTNTLELFKELKKIDDKTTLVVGKPNGNVDNNELLLALYDKLALDNNVKLLDYPEKGKFGTIVLFLKMILTLLFMRVDIVHCESPYYTFVPWILRKKFVVTMHVTDIFPCASYKVGNHCIAISEETKRWAIEKLGHKEEDITIVYHGVSTDFAKEIDKQTADSIRDKYQLDRDKIVIGMVGSIEKRKGYDILLEAFTQLPQNIKDRCEIVFVGGDKDGRGTAWLNGVIENTKTSQYIRRIEFTNPIMLYKVMDIFVLPSRQEGFPVVTLEALLSNCCCIRSNTEGATAQIEDGKSGFIFPNKDVDKLREILTNVIENDGLRRKIAKAGKQKALNEFISPIMAKNTYDVYKKVVYGKA